MTIEEISAALGLVGPAEYPQDWGICNSDADRVPEFLAFYAGHSWAQGEHMELADLILGSVAEAFRLGKPVDVDPDDLRGFIRECWTRWPDSLKYWLDYSARTTWGMAFGTWLAAAIASCGGGLVCDPGMDV